MTDPARIDRAAFALFASQVESFGLPEAAARLEWDTDTDLREFWRGQARIAAAALEEES